MTKRLSIAAASLCLGLAAWLPARAEEPVIFEMADGNFYDPSTGFVAESRAMLLRMIADPSLAPAIAPPPVDPAPSAPSIHPAAEPTAMRRAIERAREMLSAKIEKERPKKPPVVSSTDVWVEVTLAVWNAATDEIRLVEVRKNGAKMAVETEGVDVDISVRKSNGVNSEFVIDDGGENVVVGVQYPIFKEKVVSRKKRQYELHDVVYVPYSPRLHTPEMAEWGRETLRGFVRQAYEELRALGVGSRAYPGRLVSDVVDPRLVEAIAVIEHVSERALLGENGPRVHESVYVILAANQRDAYAYSRSSAGAKGLVQFIPGTYALMAKRKELGLIQDFERGMSDPVNAIKASVAYLDAELAGMPPQIKDLYLADPLKAGEFLAAAYNGGGARIRKAIKAWGEAWDGDHEADIAELKRQHAMADADIASLKARIQKTSDAKKLKALKAELVEAQARHDRIYARQLQVKSGTLRAETVMYVKKLRRALGTDVVQYAGA
jgi:hypothetical protein